MIKGDDWGRVEFSDFVGETLDNVIEGLQVIEFHFKNGAVVHMLHTQDCCEDVFIEDICGDSGDLLNTPIMKAEERTNDDPHASESGTWTFYFLQTAKGSVNIRWYGSSNGYYSESVNLELIKGAKGNPNFEGFMQKFSGRGAFDFDYDTMQESFNAGMAFAYQEDK